MTTDISKSLQIPIQPDEVIGRCWSWQDIAGVGLVALPEDRVFKRADLAAMRADPRWFGVDIAGDQDPRPVPKEPT